MTHYTHPIDTPKTADLTDPFIEYWWDSMPWNSGWYARIIRHDGEVVDKSDSPWFPVRLYDYIECEQPSVGQALANHYEDSDVLWLSDA